MVNRKIVISFLALLLAMIFGSCMKQQKTYGPYFGNGFHNGWADQHSIVLWTRLTEKPDGNVNGELFMIPSPEEHQRLNINALEEDIYHAQIPEGLKLKDMDGACPGASGEVKLTYFPEEDPSQTIETDWVKVNDDENFTTRWKLEHLSPDTRYLVKMEARAGSAKGISDEIEGTFITPPSADSERDISFCIVTCHDYMRRDSAAGHKIYEAMSKLSPDFYVHTGDIEYYDKAEPFAMTEALMRFKWDRLFALPLQRKFWTQTTCYFMKDDHDALCNDAWPGMTYGTVSWDRGLEIFDREQFPSNDKPYKTIRWGKDLQIWITEGRNYRSVNTDPDGPGKSIWGKEQKDWLFRTMEESDATFKILISPDPILGPDRVNKHDNYSNSNWKYEGDEIREFIDQHDNIFICNGDRHWQYVTHLENTNLWEFSCGAGSDIHAGGWSQDDLRPEHRFLRVKGGFLEGSISHKNDKVVLSFQHRDVHGTLVHMEAFVR